MPYANAPRQARGRTGHISGLSEDFPTGLRLKLSEVSQTTDGGILLSLYVSQLDSGGVSLRR